MKTEVGDLNLRLGNVLCTHPDCPSWQTSASVLAVAYEDCPVCGEMVVARCTDCGGQEACTQVLHQHMIRYHDEKVGCRS
jgi:predicted RNA-binding Zn-ribbon protein involved in translation (DUF1610 family)